MGRVRPRLHLHDRAVIRAALCCLLLAVPARAETALRLLAHSAAGTLDPQVNYTAQFWQLYSLTYDGLVAFRKVPGPRGTELVPDLAEAVPEPDAQLTYRFRLRRGIRFSDGSPLRPEDVVASLRRLFRVRSPTAETFYGAIEGAEACVADPEHCTLSGVAASGDEVSIRLSRPDPEFLAKLALPHASVLPASAPAADAGTAPLPGTGAYRFESYDPSDRMRIVRNPFFHAWSQEAQPDGVPDRIDYEFGLEDEAEVTAIEIGAADWMFDTPPADRLGELGARYREQVHLNRADALWFVPLNLHLPPFDDVRVRQAFNLAVDRAATLKLFGGPAIAEPTCQVLPPGLPGYQSYCPYPYDPAEARRLVAESGKAGQVVTLVTDDSPVSRALGVYLRDVLAGLGFDARTRTLSGNVQFPFIQNSNNKVQASLTTWYADYPSAANFLLGVFGCAAFHPGSDSSPNIAGFCDHGLDDAVGRALAARDLAGLAAVDRAITDQAPAVVLLSPRYIDVVSAKLRGYAYHEVFRWMVGRAGVQ